MAAKLHEMPVNDVFTANGTVGPNGRMFHDMYLFEVKKPADSKGEWDYYNQLATIPGNGPSSTPPGGCPLVTK